MWQCPNQFCLRGRVTSEPKGRLYFLLMRQNDLVAQGTGIQCNRKGEVWRTITEGVGQCLFASRRR